MICRVQADLSPTCTGPLLFALQLRFPAKALAKCQLHAKSSLDVASRILLVYKLPERRSGLPVGT